MTGKPKMANNDKKLKIAKNGTKTEKKCSHKMKMLNITTQNSGHLHLSH